MGWIRGRARCLRKRDGLWYSPRSERLEGWRNEARRGLPAWARGPAAGHDSNGRSGLSVLQGLRSKAVRAGLHHFLAAKPLYLHRPLSNPSEEGEPAEEDPFFDHHAATPANRRLAQDSAPCRSQTDWVLRAELRREDRHAGAGPCHRLRPCDLLRGLQRVGLEERLDSDSVQTRLA